MSGQTPDTVWPPLSLAAAQVKPSSPVSLTSLDPPLSAPHVRQRDPLDTKPGCTPYRRPPPYSTLRRSPLTTAYRFKACHSRPSGWVPPHMPSKIHFPCSSPKGCLPDKEHTRSPWVCACTPRPLSLRPGLSQLPTACPHPCNSTSSTPAPEPPVSGDARVAETLLSSAPHSRLSSLPGGPSHCLP